jgi:hypothetical protein
MVTLQKNTAPAALPNTQPPAARTPAPATFSPSTPSSMQPSAAVPQRSEDEIRDYANHLFVQRGSVHGHDSEDWLEAQACLGANIPKESSRTRLHHHSQITERAALSLVKHGRS